MSPEDGEPLEGITILEVEATDDNKVSDVEFRVNQGNWRKIRSFVNC